MRSYKQYLGDYKGLIFQEPSEYYPTDGNYVMVCPLTKKLKTKFKEADIEATVYLCL